MAVKILMPALSPTMEDGTLANWQKKEGDKVAPGDILAEIETDKATMEVEAVDEGVLGKIIVPAGSEKVKINSVIAILLEEGEGQDAIDALDLSTDNAVKSDAKTEAKPTVTPAPVSAPTPTVAPTPTPVNNAERIFASPLAKRLVRDYGLDLRNIQGTAAHGRITKADVENAKASGSASNNARMPSSAYQVRDLSPMPDYQSLKPDNIRKVIARRLTQSKQEVPHFYVTAKVNINQLMALRAQYNAPFEEKAQKISVNDLIIKASALALKDVPEANASWLGDEIRQYNRADISVAVGSPKGLITPIIRDAENKPIGMIASEMKALIAKANQGKLQPIEYEGGTFSVSNLGMFGVDEFKAIINPPQGCILAVGQAVKTPIYDAHDNLVPAMMLSLSIAVDHRVIDGVVAAQYLAALKKHLENPLWLFI
ncbi:MAG: pyruvate dehydrogenase complex dihydrolipoamide acetyltransferase [Alphaproteobacteria bacterium]|nr:pyruvate dehydrogenase complex dihydrolipoamide acetyltransferase [Alphaproteobacteria bacterium]